MRRAQKSQDRHDDALADLMVHLEEGEQLLITKGPKYLHRVPVRVTKRVPLTKGI